MVPDLPPMVILLTFLLGIGNFAMHKAVIESRHPILRDMPGMLRAGGGGLGLAVEFAILLTALLLINGGHPGWGWAYLGYSLFNMGSAWLILSRRI